MHRIATALGLLLLMSAPVVAQKEFEPIAAERKTIDDYIDKTAGDSELEQMSKCIGLIADPCFAYFGMQNTTAGPVPRTAVNATDCSFVIIGVLKLPTT